MNNETISKEQLLAWLFYCAQSFNKECLFLTQLDTDIGDADHGINMKRGFDRVADKLSGLEKQQISDILKTTGMILSFSIGGASGPLYSSFFMRASQAVINKEKLNLEDLLCMLSAGLDGIIERGRAQPGDKTLCDVWWPAIDAGQQALDNNLPLNIALQNICQRAEEAVTRTIEMQAKKGIASYLGARSVGYQDPGATSTLLILKALKKAQLES
ncbi:dihydroxyacetone kinase [Psychromonas sp. CNPT3]|uniref:dihydroxyacetone kinase subunit DhaL n=1 Tax=Psychromonas sp. CNPT3 TaxID=314282 RepID=UPI00006E891F|nr:dihydroxyacetone kinase subunit DhaL [Psychromonas sp. CNPT3]AGH82403.1 dihydroxyacetone kinase [Psychromonas sp. CNPT3]